MGNTFLMNLVQIGLTVSAAALVLFALRKMMKKRYPARAVCIVWAILAVRLLLPVQLTLPEAPVQLTPRTTYLTRTDFAPAQLAQAGLPVIEQDGETTTRRWVTAEQAQALTPNDMPSLISFDLGHMLMWLWGLGMAVFAGWQVLMYCSFAYLLRSSDAPVGRNTLRRVFEEQKRSLGIARDIPLLVSPAADCPMLAGFIRPALYLPDENLSEQEAVFIFRHELVHYKRGDLWLKLLLTAAKTMHWFNPLVHLLARLAQEDIELACDDAVVRGMDGAARRAYGEAILRSAVAQSRRQSALISCFTGDKETLMRRFEGIFDTRVKKRGAALVIAATVLIGVFGCALSVGENKDALTDKERVALAEQWAQRGDSMDYTVKLDGDDTYVLYDIHFEYLPEVAVPYRAGERLTFEKGADGWQVVKGEAVTADADGYVTSLDEFKILYENDLGLPDFLSVPDANAQIDISTPEQAAANLLYLQGNTTVRAGAQQDIRDVAVTFADGSEVVITMIRQFGEGWLPQDFTYDGGKNARTAADLARQYARGVMHKSGQYIYPILTAQMQRDFQTRQALPEGGFSWQYGGEQLAYDGYTVVPTDSEDSCQVEFWWTDRAGNRQRITQVIETARADGRRVIASVRQLAQGGDETFTIRSADYHNPTYGYTLTLPDCFVGQGYAVETENGVRFGLQNAMPGYSGDPTDGGTVMHLQAEATAYLRELYGEDWQANYHVPCRQLAERDGLTWYLTFASDVQYDTNDEDITAAYAEMAEAARAMEGSALSFAGQTAEQRTNEQELLLRALARIYAAQNDSTAELIRDKVTIHPEAGDNAVRIVIRFTTRNRDYFFTRAERVWYDRTDTITPSRTELLVDTSDGVRSHADFLLAFPLEQGFPIFEEEGLERLSEMAAKPASLENPDLSTPETCAEYVLHLVTGAWIRRTGSEDDDEMGLTYRWDDGEMTIRMQRVQLSDNSPVLWLPIGYDGWQPQYPPYLRVVARMMAYYPYRSTGELLQALAMGWVDGAYAEAVLAELDKRWQQDAAAVEQAIAGVDAPVQTLWQQHKAANPDLFGARFTAAEIEAAYQAVRAYAAANGFSVENLRYDAAHDSSFSEDSMSSGVLKDNVQEDGLTRGDVITVLGDAHFGENAWRDKVEGWAFTLYRGADGKWVLEDGAFGY